MLLQYYKCDMCAVQSNNKPFMQATRESEADAKNAKIMTDMYQYSFKERIEIKY